MYKTNARDDSGNNNNGGVPVPHICIICEMMFNSANALIDHMRSAHAALMGFSGSVIEIYVSMMNETTHQDSKQIVVNSNKMKKISLHPLSWKRRRSTLPVRKPNPSISSFVIYYPCSLCKTNFKTPSHRETHALGCLGVRVPRRLRSGVTVKAQQPQPPVQLSSVRAVRRKIDVNNPAPPDDSVCRKFDLNQPPHREDDDDIGPSNAPIA